ncbi:protein FAM214A [Coccinella septempunctata]|uniref:protein FAM214A n=1 Tax=Coccinella septempunctata TaxID=41139 RepID=UPI001D0833C1|nr:protein FAM214A [Coccinella septempunctata]XP_044744712.1 protein FAM214A [Coccinella septempunctata]XP_044744713.1 protein FAM214A [Coccinella septempunctata]
MHSPSLSSESKGDKSEKEVLLTVTSLVTEGRIPEKLGPKSKGFREGPHCKAAEAHTCDASDSLCANYEFFREEVLRVWAQNLPITLEVILTCGCPEGEYSVGPEVEDNCILLESWNFSIISKRNSSPPSFQLAQLMGAIRSQLYFSQITAWLTTPNENAKRRLTSKHLRYRMAQPGNGSKSTKFLMNPVEHNFPVVQVGYDTVLKVSFRSMPRMSSVPIIQCQSCKPSQGNIAHVEPEMSGKEMHKKFIVPDRLTCSLNGKHQCDDNERPENEKQSENVTKFKRLRQNLREEQASTSTINHINSARQINNQESRFGLIDTSSNRVRELDELDNDGFYDLDEDKSEALLKAIERVALRTPEKTKKLEPIDMREREMEVVATEVKCGKSCNIDKSLKENSTGFNKISGRNHMRTCTKMQLVGCVCDNNDCDTCKSDKNSSRNILNHFDKGYSDSVSFLDNHKNEDTNYSNSRLSTVVQRLTFGENDSVDNRTSNKAVVPSTSEQTRFKKILNSSASMVFHKSGLPLMSSPAPVRKGKTCFDFDSSIGSVTDIKSAFFSSSFSTDDESESDGSQMSPCSPETYLAQKAMEEENKEPKAPARWPRRRRKGQASNLLGSFEESVLNGRLEPVSTVQGFTAELGASGSFVPKHLKVPVTVFFYNVGDHERMSSPYLCHIKLEKKGYCVPKVGTFQVTLKNPLGMVVKMFVVLYDLSDMPPNSKTFMRQRILFLPTDCKDENVQRTSKWLKYLIHLRFASSKSGKIYLHGDIRIIVLNKADLDTASAHDIDTKYEMRTITLMPINPRFSFRK